MNIPGMEIIKGLVFFSLGFISGYVIRGIKDSTNSSLDNEKVIALLIAGIYAISIIADILVPTYDTPIGLHGIMGGIVGFYFKKRGETKK